MPAVSVIGAAAINSAVPKGLSAADWASIRAAYEAVRYQVFVVEGGPRARNPGQQWTTCFDGRGFTTTPDAGGWSCGLKLARYGWGENLREVALPRSVSAEGGRVAYAWDERLSEWFVHRLCSSWRSVGPRKRAKPRPQDLDWPASSHRVGRRMGADAQSDRDAVRRDRQGRDQGGDAGATGGVGDAGG